MFRPRAFSAAPHRISFGIGTVSFVLSLLSALTIIGYVGSARLLQNNPAAIQTLNSIGPCLTGVITLLVISGLLLGVMAMRERGNDRLLGIVGMISSGLSLLGIISLYLINLVNFLRGVGG